MIIKVTPVMDPLPMGSEPPERDWWKVVMCLLIAGAVVVQCGGCVT